MKNHIVKNVFCRDEAHPVHTEVISLAFKKLPPNNPQLSENQHVTHFSLVNHCLSASCWHVCLKKKGAVGREQKLSHETRKFSLREKKNSLAREFFFPHERNLSIYNQ